MPNNYRRQNGQVPNNEPPTSARISSEPVPFPGESGTGEDVGASRATIVIYSVITLMGVMAAASAKAYVDNSWDLSVLVVSSAVALSAAHAWAAVLAQMLAEGRHLSRDLVYTELKFAGLALAPAGLIVAGLALATLVTDDFEREVTIVMLGMAAVLFWAGFVSASRMKLGLWTNFKWGSASAMVGLAIVGLKVALGG